MFQGIRGQLQGPAEAPTNACVMASQRLHALCGLGEGEVPVCCINTGTVSKRKATNRLRPTAAADLLSELGSDSARRSV